jgi:hypothetical protein
MKELHEYQLMDIAVQQCIIAKSLDDFGVPHGPFSETPWYPHGLPGRSYGPSLGRRGLGCGRHSLPRLGKNLSISSFHHLCIFSYIPVLQKKKVSIKSLRKRCFSYFFRSFTINIRKISCFPLFSHRFHTFRPIGATAATGSSSASSPIASAGIEVVYHPWYPRIYIHIYMLYRLYSVSVYLYITIYIYIYIWRVCV